MSARIDRQPSPTVNARISPRGGLDVLSRDEVARLRDASTGGMHDLLRRCALAVLTSGSASDDPRAAQRAAIPISTSRCSSRTAASASTWTTRRRWPSSTARSSAASPSCCSPSCATSPTPRSSCSDSGRSTSTPATASPTPCSALLRNARVLHPHATRTWSCAGAATRSAATSTSTPSRSATSSACAASTSAPAAARVR